MKIGIHYTKANWSFCHHWIEYCLASSIPHKLVNAYSNNIIEELADCDIFIWHHNHMIHTETLFAKQLLYALEIAGKKIFPDFHTGWHFDDKLGQKYLLESVNAPMAKSYAFYDWATAKKWINTTKFPKVFKLRGGSGSTNVSLIHSKKEALRIAERILSKGISSYNRIGDLKENCRKYKLKQTSLKNLLKSVLRIMLSTNYARKKGKEIGYAYFQNFIPNNNCDIRLIVVGGKRAYGMKRLVRENDFRASGSNNFIYDEIDKEILKIGFETANKLNLQAVAFDFVYDINGSPLIIEMSYAYGTKGSGQCNGYWSNDLVWHEGPFNPFGWIIDDLIETKVKSNNK